MQAVAITPTIGVTIGREIRLYHAHVTNAPIGLDAPLTMTLYKSTFADVVGFAANPITLEDTQARTPGRLVLIETTQLDWQKKRYREGHYTCESADSILVGLNTLQHWLWQRLQARHADEING